MLSDTPETRELSPADALEAALDWWREAGVEDDYQDEATSWLAEPEVEQAVTSRKPVKAPEEPKQTPLDRAFENSGATKPIAAQGSPLPQTLENFREWWMSDKSLHPSGPESRLPPRGVAGAKVMILVPEPIDGDSEALVSGAPGKFLDAMLNAMGIAPHEAYVASALPAPLALPDWSDMAERGLGAVTQHHVSLAKPRRVLALGRSLAPLFGIEPALAREPNVVKAGEDTLPLLLAPDLDELMRSAPRRRAFWNRWLEWTE